MNEELSYAWQDVLDWLHECPVSYECILNKSDIEIYLALEECIEKKKEELIDD